MLPAKPSPGHNGDPTTFDPAHANEAELTIGELEFMTLGFGCQPPAARVALALQLVDLGLEPQSTRAPDLDLRPT